MDVADAFNSFHLRGIGHRGVQVKRQAPGILSVPVPPPQQTIGTTTTSDKNDPNGTTNTGTGTGTGTGTASNTGTVNQNQPTVQPSNTGAGTQTGSATSPSETGSTTNKGQNTATSTIIPTKTDGTGDTTTRPDSQTTPQNGVSNTGASNTNSNTGQNSATSTVTPSQTNTGSATNTRPTETRPPQQNTEPTSTVPPTATGSSSSTTRSDTEPTTTVRPTASSTSNLQPTSTTVPKPPPSETDTPTSTRIPTPSSSSSTTPSVTTPPIVPSPSSSSTSTTRPTTSQDTPSVSSTSPTRGDTPTLPTSSTKSTSPSTTEPSVSPSTTPSSTLVRPTPSSSTSQTPSTDDDDLSTTQPSTSVRPTPSTTLPTPSTTMTTPSQSELLTSTFEPPKTTSKLPDPTPTSTDPPVSTSSTDPYDWVPSSTLLQNPDVKPTTEKPTKEEQPTSSGLATNTSESKSEPTSATNPTTATPSTTSSEPALPSDWPSKIVPQTNVTDDKDTPAIGAVGDAPHATDSTLISILLSTSLSWSWLLSNSDASAQVFAYMPPLIAGALKLDDSEVVTASLEAWEPPRWTGEPADVRSVWLGYIPTNKVDPLTVLMLDPRSRFYTGTSEKNITAQLAAAVDPMLPLLAYYSYRGQQEDEDKSKSKTDEDDTGTAPMSNKKTALVASAAALGAILLGVGGFFASRYAIRKKKEARYSDQDNQENQQDPQGGARGLRGDSPSPEPTAGVFNSPVQSPRRCSVYASSYNPHERYPDEDENDFYNHQPATTMPSQGDDGRSLFDSPLDVNPAASTSYEPPLNANTMRSAAGSSVQSELLRKRYSSVDFGQSHQQSDDWWQRRSQWDNPAAPPMPQNRGPTQPHPGPAPAYEPPDRPFSGASVSVYSAHTLRHPPTGQWSTNYGRQSEHYIPRQSRNVHPSSISAPYLQDNSL